MDVQGKPPKAALHLRFSPANSRHMEAAAFIGSVKARYKNALITAAIEAYRELHPFGIDYPELERIQKQTWKGFRPASPIQRNLQARGDPPVPADPVPEGRPKDFTSTGAAQAMDRAIDFYDLNEDE